MGYIIFTITKHESGIDITTEGTRSTYNKYGVKDKDLYKVLCELTDVFNNVLKMGIGFEIDP